VTRFVAMALMNSVTLVTNFVQKTSAGQSVGVSVGVSHMTSSVSKICGQWKTEHKMAAPIQVKS
jgi:hypothetical protein